MRRMERFRMIPGITHAILVAILAGEAWAGGAVQFDRVIPNQFPVNVKAIVFDETIRIDASEPLGFGEWTVRFGPGNPRAYYTCESPCLASSPPPVIGVQGLRCDGFSTEDADCTLSITLERNGPPDCAITINFQESETILINCPRELETP
jgi:hypothetical protein